MLSLIFQKCPVYLKSKGSRIKEYLLKHVILKKALLMKGVTNLRVTKVTGLHRTC